MSMLNTIRSKYMKCAWTTIYEFPKDMSLDEFKEKFDSGEIIDDELKILK